MPARLDARLARPCTGPRRNQVRSYITIESRMFETRPKRPQSTRRSQVCEHRKVADTLVRRTPPSLGSSPMTEWTASTPGADRKNRAAGRPAASATSAVRAARLWHPSPRLAPQLRTRRARPSRSTARRRSGRARRGVRPRGGWPRRWSMRIDVPTTKRAATCALNGGPWRAGHPAGARRTPHQTLDHRATGRQ
jgi:hypothetical protein